MKAPAKRLLAAGGMALAGFADATYLSVKHLYSSDAGCLVTEGCDTVLSSTYAELFGIPLAFLGWGYYTAVLLLLTAYGLHEKPLAFHAARVVVTGGIGFSAYLLHVQANILNAFCSWCLFSAAMTLGIGLMLWFGMKNRS